MIIVTNLGVLKDATVDIASSLGDEYFVTASNFISAAFHGKTIGEILEPDKLIEEIKKDYEQLFKAIITIIKDYVENGGVGDIVLEGSAKICLLYTSFPMRKAKSRFAESILSAIPLPPKKISATFRTTTLFTTN